MFISSGGVVVYRAAKCSDRFFGPPLHQGPITGGDVPPVMAIVKGNGPNGVLATRQHRPIAIDPAHVHGEV